MMDGTEVKFSSDCELFDRLEFIEKLTSIKGYEIDFSTYENEWNSICDELDNRTKPPEGDRI